MKKKQAIYIGAGAAVLLIGICLFWLIHRFAITSGMPEGYHPIVVKEQTLSSRMYLRGLLDSSEKIPIFSRTAGALTEIVVSGKHVKKGELLFSIDSSSSQTSLEGYENTVNELNLSLEQTRAQYDLAKFQEDNKVRRQDDRVAYAKLLQKEELAQPDARKRRLMEIEEELAELSLKDAQANYDKQYKLYEKKFITLSALDSYTQKLENAKAVLEETKLKNAIERKGATEERRTELQKGVERAEYNRKRADMIRTRRLNNIKAQIVALQQDLAVVQKRISHCQEQIDNASIYSPHDGVFLVYTYWDWTTKLYREVREGDEKRINDIIGHVINPKKMIINFVVNEADYPLIRTGMPVKVTLPALPQLQLTGTIKTLSSIGRDRTRADMTAIGTGTSEVMVFRGTLEIKEYSPLIHPGMSAIIEMAPHKEVKGIFLPRQAILWRDRRPSVLTAKHGEVNVKGRIFDEHYFQILDGLKEGDVVFSK